MPTLTGKITDLGITDLDARGVVEATVETQVDGYVGADNALHLDKLQATTSGGVLTITDLPDTSQIENLRLRLHLNYIAVGPGGTKKRSTFTSGWFEATADLTLADVVDSSIPNAPAITSVAGAVTEATTAATTATTAKADALAAQAAAEAARDEAASITAPLTAPANEQVASYIANPGAAQTELDARYAAIVAATGVTGTDTANIQAAIDAGGRILLTPPPLGIAQPITTAQLIIKTGAHLDLGGCTLQTANTVNADLIRSKDFDSLTGTGSADSPYSFTIRNGIIDGNRANNTSGRGLSLYAAAFRLSDLVVRNCADDGLYTEWAGTGTPPDGMEAHINGLTLHDNGGWGWHHRGPHDSTAHQVVVYSNNQKGLNAGGIWAENDSVAGKYSVAGTHFTDCHVWGTSHKWAFINEGTVITTGCQIEGGSVGQVLALGTLIMRGGKIFTGSSDTSPRIGIQLGDNGSTAGYDNTRVWNTGSHDIDTLLSGFLGLGPDSAPIKWVGANTSRVRAYAVMANASATLSVSGTWDKQSQLDVVATHGSATPAQRAAWSVRSRSTIDRWYGGSGGAINTFKIDASIGHVAAPGQVAVLTLTPHGNSGAGATATSGGNDMRGQIAVTAGTGTIAAGTAVTVKLPNAFTDGNPTVVVSPASSNAAALNPYGTATAADTFIVGFSSAMASGQTYYVNYWLIG